uniref:Uncharacterized protein n=1 Tax=Oryza glumipatula TaxID=40148 RepID=A0A0E0AKS2_9ORYZ
MVFSFGNEIFAAVAAVRARPSRAVAGDWATWWGGAAVAWWSDAIGSVATDGRHDQEQPQHHPFSHRLPLQWQARPDGVASMAASSPPSSLWKMTTGGTAATRGGGGTADTSKCHRRAKNIHHAPLPPSGPSTLLSSNSLWWSQRHWDDLRSVGAADKMMALGSTAACVHRRCRAPARPLPVSAAWTLCVVGVFLRGVDASFIFTVGRSRKEDDD